MTSRTTTGTASGADGPAAPPGGDDRPLDLAGIGIGPFNLSLAALAHGVPDLRTACYEQRPGFSWHPGLLIEGATLQVPFLADLVTLADPASPWSFLSYLKARDRLFPFYFAERFHIERAEYDDYCRWVSEQLCGLHFGHRIDAVRWNPLRACFELEFTRLTPAGGTAASGGTAPSGYTAASGGDPASGPAPPSGGLVRARNICLGIGTAPHVPEPLRPLAETPTLPVLHSAEYLDQRARLLAAEHVTVVGSGQSGAEIFLDLLRHRPAGHEGLHWLTRSPAFAPMEYSKLGLEHFTPDYTRYFHALPESTREGLVPRQWQLHKAVDHGTLAAIHDELYHRTLHGGWPDAVLTPGVRVRTGGRIGTTRLELHLEHAEQERQSRLVTDAVVLATGYRERSGDGLLAALDPYLRRDSGGRPRIDDRYRLLLDPSVTGTVFVQNAERHTHGVGTPDLGLAAHRSATILNTLTGAEVYRLPRRTAFTSFGLGDERSAGGRPRNGQARESEKRTVPLIREPR